MRWLVVCLVLNSLFVCSGSTDTTPPHCPFLVSTPNGIIQYTEPNLLNKIDGWYKVKCKSGYREDGTEDFRKCLKSGQWGGGPKRCLNNRCPNILGLQFGSSGVKRDAGRIAVYKCNSGYKMVGQKSIRCLKETVKWETTPPKCVPHKCPYITEFRNGKIKHPLDNRLGKKVTFECDKGFEIRRRTDKRTSRCRSNLQWGPEVPTCRCIKESSDECVSAKTKCPFLIGVPHSEKPKVVSGDGTGDGSELKLTCKRGYRISGNEKVTCTAGKWSELPTCEDNHCPHVEHIENGKVDKKNDYAPGAKIKITCTKNHVPEVQADLLCGDDRKWSHPPKCVENACPDLLEFKNGVILKYNNSVGSKISYKCDDGFTLVGVRTNECEESRNWRDAHPSCQAVVECSRTDSAVGGLTYSGTSNSAYAFLGRSGSDGLWSPDVADSDRAADIATDNGFISDVSFSFQAKDVTVIFLTLANQELASKTVSGDSVNKLDTDVLTADEGIKMNVQKIRLVFSVDTGERILFRNFKATVCKPVSGAA